MQWSMESVNNMPSYRNNVIDKMQGYLSALNYLNGAKLEFTSTVDMTMSDDDTTAQEIQALPVIRHLNELKIVERKLFPGGVGIVDDNLATLLFPKLCTGLYPPLDTHRIPEKTLNAYINYCVYNFADYIDFAFDEAGVHELSKDIEFLLLEERERYFISIVLKHGKIKLWFFFHRKFYSKEDMRDLYEKVVSTQENWKSNFPKAETITDYLYGSITDNLEPIMVKNGFYRHRRYLFVRVEGDIVSVLTLRWASKGAVHLHCFYNLLPSGDPESTLKRYDVGKMYTCNDQDDIPWISTDVENTHKMIFSIIELVERELLAWLDSITTIEDYIVEYMDSKLDDIWAYDKKLESYFALIGKDYLESYLKMGNQFNHDGNKEELHRLIAMTRDKAIDQEYLIQLRNKNIVTNNFTPVRTIKHGSIRVKGE